LGVKENSHTPSPDESQKQEDELMLRHTTLCAFVVFIMVMGAAYGRTPEDVCGKYQDNAWGLCNAYCTAMDCEGDRNNSGRACTQVALNFSLATGGDLMPCAQSAAPTGSSLGSCPCNFDVEFWTEQPQILDRPDPPLCTGDFSNCITCGINNMSSSTTFLSILVNLWADGFSSQEDKLFFFTAAPSSLLGGSCGADGSFASGDSFTTPDGELSVTSGEFSACVSDIEILKEEYLRLCRNR
jgi:hypothetical protein